MSWEIGDSWAYIEGFRSNGQYEEQDIVDLDVAMMAVLRELNIETYAQRVGWGPRFPRYQTSYPDMTEAEEIQALETHLRARVNDIRRLETLIDNKKRELRRRCQHEWLFDDDHRCERSRHVCLKCGQSR